jgi:prephenate dehydrogenase
VKVAVLGVGLIGGSIGLAARGRAAAHVSGYDPDPGVCRMALERGAIDEQAADVVGAVDGADVVFVAAPVGALMETVEEALGAAGPDCVVSDVGSTKRTVAGAGRDRRFVGGHPLAGAETAGVEHASADLFAGAVWYLTSTQETDGGLYERLHGLLQSLGALPTAIEAEAHDQLMACVSHLPHVLANVLVAQAAAQATSPAHAGWPLLATGPSFRDATRVAGANTAVWTDIYLANRDALIVAVDEAARRLAEVRAALATGDGRALAAWNERARADRERLLGAGATAGA